jgi:hypothetical protein
VLRLLPLVLVLLAAAPAAAQDRHRAPLSAKPRGDRRRAGLADALSPSRDGADDDEVDPEGPIARPERWPFSLRSTVRPARVHWREPGEAAMAREVLRLVEAAWTLNVDELGFRPPPADGGTIGPDEAFDVFLDRGAEECAVDVHAEIPSTARDDRTAFMVVDPWGPYGGDALPATLAHELNHACQAADDWSDLAAAYEMTATWVEHLAAGGRWPEGVLEDLQARPGWAFDHDDGYETWSMYGGGLFLEFVVARQGGDRRLVAEVWERLRGPTHLEKALDAVLRRRGGAGLEEAALAFAAWRVAPPGAPKAAVAARLRVGGAATVEVEPYGVAVMELVGRPHTRLTPRLEPAPGARWVLLQPTGSRVEGALRLGATGRLRVALACLPGPSDDPTARRAHQVRVEVR